MKVWELYYEGYNNDQIADMLDITVWDVVKIVNPKY